MRVQQCVTPDRRQGGCVDLRQCAVLFNLIQKPGISYEERNFLRQSQCAYYNNYPWVNFTHFLLYACVLNCKFITIDQLFFFFCCNYCCYCTGLLSEWCSASGDAATEYTITKYSQRWRSRCSFTCKWFTTAWPMRNCHRWSHCWRQWNSHCGYVIQNKIIW